MFVCVGLDVIWGITIRKVDNSTWVTVHHFCIEVSLIQWRSLSWLHLYKTSSFSCDFLHGYFPSKRTTCNDIGSLNNNVVVSAIGNGIKWKSKHINCAYIYVYMLLFEVYIFPLSALVLYAKLCSVSSWFILETFVLTLIMKGKKLMRNLFNYKSIGFILDIFFSKQGKLWRT